MIKEIKDRIFSVSDRDHDCLLFANDRILSPNDRIVLVKLVFFSQDRLLSVMMASFSKIVYLT